jgi:hypothetical protein
MKFVSDGIGAIVMKELGLGTEACLAVAYFNPNERMLDALGRLKKLKLIVSEEFTMNNPYKLEKLTRATLRSVPPGHADGKLHAKVLIVRRRDGSYWCLLGSANLTHQGMFSNQEACVVMESENPADAASVRAMRDWFDPLFQGGQLPDLKQAKLIFDTRSQYRLVPRTPKEAKRDVGYWALKTTSGSTGKQYWPMFLAEKVIAVGWEDIAVDPSKVTDASLCAAIQEGYPDDSSRSVLVSASSIKKFVELKVDDIVLLCRGYAANQYKDVHIHGIARVTGPFRAGSRKKGGWRFKHDAVIQEINMDLPRDVVASALGRDSLRQTIHALTKADFERLAMELKDYGAHVEV